MTTVEALGEGLYCIDLDFQGMEGVIAAYVLEDSGERALIEIGPGSTLPSLLAGLEQLEFEPESISKVLVTHIHLDHAGASGEFLRRVPQSRLYVHRVGAPHMIDPVKLLASASRIYGDMMEPLWGRFEAVPEERVTVIDEGDCIAVGGRRLDVLYTPGHASHHVIFHDVSTGGVFTGDVAATRLQGFRYVRPPVPPPDIDLEQWSGSIERVRALNPRAIDLTHFGRFTDVERHLEEAKGRLYDWARVVERAVESGQDRVAMVDTLRLHGDQELLGETSDARVVERYELAAPYGMSVDGYLRYFRRRERAAAKRSET